MYNMVCDYIYRSPMKISQKLYIPEGIQCLPASHACILHIKLSVCLNSSEDMGICDGADRLKILQQITSMKADLVTSGSASPTRRIRSPIKGRQFRDCSLPNNYAGGGRVCRGSRSQRSGSGGTQTLNRYVNVLIQNNSPRTSDSGTSVISPTQLSTDQTSSDSQESSRISTPDKQLQEMVLSEVTHRRNLDDLNKLRTVATLRYHNVKRLSRSLDHLFPVCSIFMKTTTIP